MTYPNPQPYGQPTPPQRKKRTGLVAALVLLALGLLCLCGGVVLASTGGDHSDDRGIAVVESPEPSFVPPASTKPAAKSVPSPTPAPPTTLSTKTLTLSVKITSKQCFGSAGCIVEWEIKGSVRPGVRIDGPCDVTYEVRGLTETQTHTLTVNDDGTYEQDIYQSGQTPRSSAKVTAKATEVECR
jgi:hypothetical protein